VKISRKINMKIKINSSIKTSASKITNASIKKKTSTYLRYILATALILAAFTGCGYAGAAAASQAGVKDYGKITLGYSGDITEVPLFAALDQGFFKAEGLDVELVKVDFNNIRQEFESGRITGISADYRYLQAISDGLDVKLISGLHSGCTQILISLDSDIDTIKKLKGKAIGVEALGNGPMVIAAKLLRNNGIDPAKDVKWKEYKGSDLYKAIITYEVDALSVWEAGIGYQACSVLFSTSDTSSDSHSHAGYQHFYGSFIALDSTLVKKQQNKASAISRAWMQGVKWVAENGAEAARLAVKKEYVDLDEGEAIAAVGDYMWMPGVRNAQIHLKDYIREQKAQGVLPAETNENEFFKDIFKQIVPDFSGS
jgi:NitT/TauT family transport system substrate-binding protein